LPASFAAPSEDQRHIGDRRRRLLSACGDVLLRPRLAVDDLAYQVRDEVFPTNLWQGEKYRGFAYKNLGRHKRAIADLEMYLELHPDAEDKAEVEQRIKELKGE
jgi:regulator of sirC expression with transglutaminase-like and TPR domain